ncbi:uncharacterized protein A4U43_C01F4960 [Asparagus officinalis]|uniref:RNase H type-1 domain-containing protein n=1 Tax=Asparagus officinalis TaxID=4686 RepID=A0A5P1FQM5_ASPOF|nr:uncharacterized protein A4U43_C01F4960 [Asparagus officinalis]
MIDAASVLFFFLSISFSKFSRLRYCASVDWEAGYTKDFQEPLPSVKSKSCSSSVKRDPPASGMVCINVDAAVDRNGSGCSSGIVARDHNSVALYSRGNYYMNPFSPLIAEIIAIKDGVLLAKERKWNQWFIVSDCHNAVDLLSNPEVQSGELDLLADEVRSLAMFVLASKASSTSLGILMVWPIC